MRSQSEYPLEKFSQTPKFSESEEGGLNLVELRETIFRQIHIIAGVTAVVASLALVRVLTRTPVYKANFEILSEPVTIETKVTSSGSQSSETREEIVAVTLDEVQAKSLKSPNLILPVVDQLREKYPKTTYNSVVNNLNLIITEQEQSILEAVYEHPNKQYVKDVLETLAKAYLDYSLEKRQYGVNRGLEFLNRQIPKVQAQVDELHQQIQLLRQENNFIEPVIQARQLSERLEKLVQQQLEISAQLEQAESRAESAVVELTQEPTQSTTSMEIGTSRYNELLAQLRQIDSQIAQQSTVFAENSPTMQTLREQREELVALIAQEGEVVQNKASNQIKLLQSRNQTINKEIDDLKEKIRDWSGVTRDYEDIERKLTITVEQLNELVAQREALRIDAAQTEAPWRLLTPVSEPQTDSASIVNFLLLGTTFGLLLGVGIALAIDKYQNIIYSSTQVQEITNLPILGIIPFDWGQKKLPFPEKMLALASSSESSATRIQIYNSSYSLNLLSSSTEAFRFLVANLGLFEPDNSISSLIVTSAIPGEGKSTVAFNLAKTAAVMGQKVLLMDTDMRNPNLFADNQESFYGLGLSNLLMEDELEFQHVIQQSSLEENLFIITSGTAETVIDPSRLLASRKMHYLMEKLRASFDLVIYDVSSIIGFADVSFLVGKTDGVVLVTGLGKLQSLKLREALNQLSVSNTPILGIVVNKVNSK